MVRHLLSLILISALIAACNSNAPVVQKEVVDSIITHHTTSDQEKVIEADLAFWKKRMDSIPDDIVNGPKYASSLYSRFHLYGNIEDLQKADSLTKESSRANGEKDADIFLKLCSYAMLQHQFRAAETYLQKAKKIAGNTYGVAVTSFDVYFELGRYEDAIRILNSVKEKNNYPYYFRKSKYEHVEGSLDSSIALMLRAADNAENNIYLQQVALSNAGDLCIHKGDLKKAYELYLKSLQLNSADFHSMMGIGWVALLANKDDSLAEKIFLFVRDHNALPDPLFKLSQAAQSRGDSMNEKRWAAEFAEKAGQPAYGAMYNKYLIELYTGILRDPQKALALAVQEINNRPTPQTYAWYVWALLCNNEKDKAYSYYRTYVSQRPLEGLELYYMGKLMQAMGKKYDAKEFFKAAYKNRYDLSPAKRKDVE